MTRKGRQNLDLTSRAQRVRVSTGASAFRLCALNLAEEALWVTGETGSARQQHSCPHDMELAIQRGYPSGPGSREARKGRQGLDVGMGCRLDKTAWSSQGTNPRLWPHYQELKIQNANSLPQGLGVGGGVP